MLIDWFTVGAQALNFIVLVWLLKRFLYKPILTAIDTREKLIAAKLKDADDKEAKAQSEGDAFQKKSAAFDKERAALLIKATDEAAAQGAKLLDDAGKAADALSAKRREALKSDAHALNQTFRHRMLQEVFATARKALSDLAAADLEQRIAEVFARRLKAMSGERKATFGAALASGPDPALLRSAFDLSAKQRTAMQTALEEAFSTQDKIRFETAPNLVSGVELSAGGQKMSWNISDYLVSLESSVGDFLKDDARLEPEPSSKPAAKPKGEAGTQTKAKRHVAKPKAEHA